MVPMLLGRARAARIIELWPRYGWNGSATSATTSNVNILWNIFGSTSFADCATAMNDTSFRRMMAGAAVTVSACMTTVSNITIKNNIFHWLEEPIKTYESPSSGVCNNSRD